MTMIKINVFRKVSSFVSQFLICFVCQDPVFEFQLARHLTSHATMYDMIIDPTQKFVATACQDRRLRSVVLSLFHRLCNFIDFELGCLTENFCILSYYKNLNVFV